MSSLFFTVLGVATHYLNIFIINMEVNGLVLIVFGQSERKKNDSDVPHIFIFINYME